MDSIKSALGHVKLNLCFCIRWDICVTYWIPVRPGLETSTHYLSCLGETGRDSTKSASENVMLDLCF
jgi:hypothetical protein